MVDFINVPVPADRVQEVYALLGGEGTSTVVGPSGAAVAPPSVAEAVWTPQGDADDDDVQAWTQSMLKRMYGESVGPMRAALDYLADRGGDEVTSRELAEALGLPKGVRSLAGMIGAFARRCWNRYDRYLPWDSRWQPIQGDTVGTETVFCMPFEVAAVLVDLRNE